MPMVGDYKTKIIFKKDGDSDSDSDKSKMINHNNINDNKTIDNKVSDSKINNNIKVTEQMDNINEIKQHHKNIIMNPNYIGKESDHIPIKAIEDEAYQYEKALLEDIEKYGYSLNKKSTSWADMVELNELAKNKEFNVDDYLPDDHNFTNNFSNHYQMVEKVILQSDNVKTRRILPKLKRNNKFISILTIDLVKKDQIIFTESVNVKNKTIIISPSYNYTKSLCDLLILQTSFIEINKMPFQKSTLPSNCFNMETLELFKYYDKQVDNYIQENFNTFRCISKLINGDLWPGLNTLINTRIFDDFLLKPFSNKIYNYNISKKYKTIEEYELTVDKKISNKLFYCNKQVSFLVSPVTWINESTKMYGSYLKLYTMEIKYVNAKINSVYDKVRSAVELEITNITI